MAVASEARSKLPSDCQAENQFNSIQFSSVQFSSIQLSSVRSCRRVRRPRRGRVGWSAGLGRRGEGREAGDRANPENALMERRQIVVSKKHCLTQNFGYDSAGWNPCVLRSCMQTKLEKTNCVRESGADWC